MVKTGDGLIPSRLEEGQAGGCDFILQALIEIESVESSLLKIDFL